MSAGHAGAATWQWWWGDFLHPKLCKANCEDEHLLDETNLATAPLALFTIAGFLSASPQGAMPSAGEGPEQGHYTRWIKPVWLLSSPNIHISLIKQCQGHEKLLCQRCL